MNVIRKILAITLAAVCVVGNSVPTFAATNEVNREFINESNTLAKSNVPNVFGPGADQFAGDYDFTDHNWTPIKTLSGNGWASHFNVKGSFSKADNYKGLVKLTVKIKRVRDGAILFSKVYYPDANGNGTFQTVDAAGNSITINPNQEKIQLFVDASTYNATPPGPYRKLHIKYYFNLL